MEASESGARADGWLAVFLGFAYFALYVSTLCPTVYWYDSAEFATAAFTLGIPHPPGYPLYTLIGHAFTWLPLSPALAVNLMSATFAGVCVALTYLICRLLGTGRIAGVVGAGVLGGSPLFWANAVIAEVYCPGLAFAALTLYLLLLSRDRGRFGFSLLAALVAGLGLGVHMSIATLGLGFALLVWAYDVPVKSASDLAGLFSRAGAGMRLGRSLAAGLCAALGSLVFLYLPIRANQQPPLNIGNPSTLERFRWVVSGGNYKGWFLNEQDVVSRLGAITGAFSEQVLLVGMVLAVVGFVWLFRRRPLECLALALMALGNVAFFFRYQVHDVAVFFLPTTMLLCCFVACGAQAFMVGVARVVSEGRQQFMRRLVSVALLLFAFALALGNYRALDMSHFRETDDYIASMVEELPPNAIVLNYTTPPEWKHDAVFGMYAQKVLGLRPDVEVVDAATHGPRVVGAALASGRPVFAYAPVPVLATRLRLEPQGPAFRVFPPAR